jgi:hypothetical protein
MLRYCDKSRLSIYDVQALPEHTEMRAKVAMLRSLGVFTFASSQFRQSQGQEDVQATDHESKLVHIAYVKASMLRGLLHALAVRSVTMVRVD